VGKVFVITGPSGVGKGTLIEQLLERVPELELSVSATTREPRPGEVDGRDYHFLSPEEFRRRLEAGDFLEHASYSGNYYGTLREEVERRLAEGRSVVLEIEVQGARQVRDELGDDAVLIFIAPPDEKALRERLVGWGTDPRDALAPRLRPAEIELGARSEFPLEVVNDEVQKAAAELERLVRDDLSLH
jgi:guanylate kinase